jgi:hypothetical protein
MKTSSLIKWVAIIGLVVACLALLDGHNKLSKKNRALAEGADVLAAESAGLRKILADERIFSEGVIKLKNGEIDKLQGEKVGLLGGMAGKDRDIAALEDELEGLTNDVDIVVNLKLQIVKHVERYSLAMGVIDRQEKQLKAWEIKYNAQVLISEAWERESGSWKRQYEGEHALRLSLQKELGITKKGGAATLVAEAGVSIYGLAKGDVVPAVVFAVVEGGKRLAKFF